jgi:hypothetical protein
MVEARRTERLGRDVLWQPGALQNLLPYLYRRQDACCKGLAMTPAQKIKAIVGMIADFHKDVEDNDDLDANAAAFNLVQDIETVTKL